MKNYGTRLKKAREFLGLTQEQVSKIVGMSRNTIVNIENNLRSIKAEELEDFSKLYGITIEEIISIDKNVSINVPMYARGFEKLTTKDQEEILNLIKFKNSYDGK